MEGWTPVGSGEGGGGAVVELRVVVEGAEGVEGGEALGALDF